jgi:hypothetical protein
MRRRYLLPCLLVLVLGVSACAQDGHRGPPSGEGGAQRGGPGGQAGPGGAGGGAKRDEDMLATQLAMLHTALRLDAQQEQLWLAYTDKLQAFLGDMQRPGAASMQRDAPHQVEARIAPLRNRLAALEQISDAAERLYRRLDARQREVADEMLAATVPLLPDRIDMPTNGPGAGGPPGGGGGEGGGQRPGKRRG